MCMQPFSPITYLKMFALVKIQPFFLIFLHDINSCARCISWLSICFTCKRCDISSKNRRSTKVVATYGKKLCPVLVNLNVKTKQFKKRHRASVRRKFWSTSRFWSLVWVEQRVRRNCTFIPFCSKTFCSKILGLKKNVSTGRKTRNICVNEEPLVSLEVSHRWRPRLKRSFDFVWVAKGFQRSLDTWAVCSK